MATYLSDDHDDMQKYDDLYSKVILRKRENENQAFARLLYISMSPDAAKDEVSNEIKNWIEENNKALGEEQRPMYSGLMINKGPIILHFLECDCRELNRFLIYLHDEYKNGLDEAGLPNDDAMYKQVNILAFSEEHKYRVILL